MEAAEQIEKFREFIEQHYHAELLESVRKGENVLWIDFALFAKFDPAIADLMLEQPEEVLKAGEIACKEFDLPKTVKSITIRLKNLPVSQKLPIRNIRSAHLGKLYWFLGVVRQKSDVRPQVTSAKFECPACSAVHHILQLDQSFREPSTCSCGRKGKFTLLAKELVDVQRLTLEEVSEELDGGEQPKRIGVFLKDDLVSPLSEKKTNPGNKIAIVGVIKEVPIITKKGTTSVRFDLQVEANSMQAIEEDYTQVQISPEEEEKIRELSQDEKLNEKLVTAVAPSIYGYNRIKEALLLQILGGVRKKRDDGGVSRGDFHILLIGDPGAGKSMLLKRINTVSPKARYVSGKGASGAGLTAAVVKDEFLQGWSLEAGALVLANKGMCMIDEIDKMTKEDRSAMHEALEQQTVTISKANIQATLVCETTVLAAANPKYGRFDPSGVISDQIDMPPTLISRFDLIFPIKDIPDEAKDERLASFVLGLHQDNKGLETDVDTNFLRKYLIFAKKINPMLTSAAVTELKEYYVKMRTAGAEVEAGMRSVPITTRQLEALIRLAEAYAKLRLSEKVTVEDAKKSIELMNYCLTQLGLDPKTGKIDIDKIFVGVTASQRGRIHVIKELIDGLIATSQGRSIEVQQLVRSASGRNLTEGDVTEAVETLKKSGEIFEPKRGWISKI